MPLVRLLVRLMSREVLNGFPLFQGIPLDQIHSQKIPLQSTFPANCHKTGAGSPFKGLGESPFSNHVVSNLGQGRCLVGFAVGTTRTLVRQLSLYLERQG